MTSYRGVIGARLRKGGRVGARQRSTCRRRITTAIDGTCPVARAAPVAEHRLVEVSNLWS
jgi:hypothetical protein